MGDLETCALGSPDGRRSGLMQKARVGFVLLKNKNINKDIYMYFRAGNPIFTWDIWQKVS